MTLVFPLGTLLAFLMVLSRVAGLIALLPLPALRMAPATVRVCLSMAISIALLPAWPHFENTLPSFGTLLTAAFAEAGFGLAMGVATALFLETFQMAAQIFGLQAGFGYATTIDPTSQVDAGILQVISMLMAGLFFFATGLDGQILRLLAASFQRFSAGSGAWAGAEASVDGIIRLGSTVFSLGLRLAMPIVAFLLFLDVALALLARVQQQLQLLSLAFPVKMLTALAGLAVLLPTFSRLFERSSTQMLSMLWATLAR